MTELTETVLLTLITSLVQFLKMYMLLLSMRVTLTWFPSINWYTQPFYTLIKLTNPYLRLFKGLLPSLFGLDISPILGFMFLEAITDLAVYYEQII